MGDAGDLLVLFRDSFLRVDHEHAHIAAFDGGDGADDAELFDVFVDFAFAADACGVDQRIRFPVKLEGRIDGVARCPGDRGNDDPVLPQELVDQGGLPYIRFADHCDLDGIVFVLPGAFRKTADDLVQQIAQIQHVGRGNRNRLAKAQLIKVIEIIGQIRPVDLVDRQDHLLACLHEHLADLTVRRSQAFLAVHHEQDHIGCVDGHLRLLPHLGQDDVLAVRLDAARIDQREMHAAPFGLRVDAVACHSGRVLDDGETLPDNFIKKCGLAYIRASNYCYQR